jgi:hypothetical protein
MGVCNDSDNAMNMVEIGQIKEKRMNIIQLLQIEKFDLSKKVKMIRHTKDGEYDISHIYKSGLLIDYQGVQTRDILNDCDYLISFIATENTKAKFVGMFEITNRTTVGAIREAKGLPDLGIDDFYNDNQFYYVQNEVPILTDLKDRLIIEWGKGTIQWCQNLKEKEVIEILPRGYYNYFPGFDEVIISFDELKKIIEYPDANREWHKMLSTVAGVYLIADMETGMQYVGSAYGNEGILGRWKQYARNMHGNNKLLKEILEQDPLRYKKFQYSILRTLPKTLTTNETITIESIYKKKLGSRAFGLNSN